MILTLSVGPVKISNTLITSSNSSALIGLFTFKNLAAALLLLCVEFNVGDPDIVDLASWWSRLETLLLGRPTHTRSRVTLGGMATFALHCPNLGLLQITLNAIPTGLESYASNDEVRQTSLRNLAVGFSPITTPVPVAAFIFITIFPNVTHVLGESDGTSEPGSEEAA
ncbi:hypothetical protein B0H14DRAFT_3532732 [Mycena olivaceomarginata]|nr:hypothetical protein B0H14DRAFT_3532732 [Mycena olivaceomarginata]